MATIFPQEILIKIFKELTPYDLYSLSSVCKRFRSLLWSTSTLTQDIWRTSRLRQTIIDRSPPIISSSNETGIIKKMSEQQYLWLMILSEKCQFCDQKNKIELTLYWEGKIYCCSICLRKRVISLETLKSEWKLPENLLECLNEIPDSIDAIEWRPRMYFKSEVIRLLKEYNQVKKFEINDWLKKKKREIIKLKEENKDYRLKHIYCKYTIKELGKKRLMRMIRNMEVDQGDVITGLKKLRFYYKSSQVVVTP
ncbi:hypothetical protein C1645_756978 [Glomus cerebriforme]|uniref:F-box domain-containing protein n=1 Tax=Glomus cerebriforme TaxID=658196 RepID=A0A397TGT9_9GLOM|nr:hypothetical protein C1645_756978 [Glomus cerebriforme]